MHLIKLDSPHARCLVDLGRPREAVVVAERALGLAQQHEITAGRSTSAEIEQIDAWLAAHPPTPAGP